MAQIEVFEDALEYTGWGLYSRFILAALSFCSLTNGAATLAITLALPLSTCDIHFNENDAVTIHISCLVGKAFGGYILNAGSDVFGRKCLIPNSLIIIFSCTFAAAFCHGIYVIMLTAFFLGSGLEALRVSTKVHLAEILPVRKRAYGLVIMDIFWSVGYFITSGMAYALTDSAVIHHKSMDLKISSWRILYALCGGLCMFAACVTALIEGSPRFFIFRRRYDYAIAVLRQLYAMNKSRNDTTFEIRQTDIENTVKHYDMQTRAHNQSCSQHIGSLINRILKTTKLLLSKRFIGCTLALTLIRIATIFEMSGMNIWLARYLYYRNDDCSVNGTDFLYLMDIIHKNCNIRTNHRLYKNFFIVASNIVLGQLVTLFTIECAGRKTLIFSGLAIGGALFFALLSSHNYQWIKIFISTALMTVYSVIETTLSIVSIEVFPTCMRGTANAQIHFLAYFGACFVYKFLEMPCQYFCLGLGFYMLGASALSYFIPEMKGRPMVE